MPSRSLLFIILINHIKTLKAMEELLYKNETGLIDGRLMKEFLAELNEKAHALYAILHKSRKPLIRIVRNDDWDNIFAYMTVAEFEKQWERFASNDFQISLLLKTFYSKSERGSHIFELSDDERNSLGEDEYELGSTKQLANSNWCEEIPYILAAICRDAIIEGHPLVIDDENITEFGFTDTDVKYLKDKIDKINKELMSEFIENYERLEKIVGHTKI